MDKRILNLKEKQKTREYKKKSNWEEREAIEKDETAWEQRRTTI